MSNERMKIRQMLLAMRSQVRSDLSELAEDVLRQRCGVNGDVSQAGTDARNHDVQRLKSELALRTMASQYALLSRIDKALDPPGETMCSSP